MAVRSLGSRSIAPVNAAFHRIHQFEASSLRSAMCLRGGGRTRWMLGSASRSRPGRWPDTAGRRSSTPTRACPREGGGSYITSFEFTKTLRDAGVAISMDGRGRSMDNILVERLWRSLK